MISHIFVFLWGLLVIYSMAFIMPIDAGFLTWFCMYCSISNVLFSIMELMF